MNNNPRLYISVNRLVPLAGKVAQKMLFYKPQQGGVWADIGNIPAAVMPEFVRIVTENDWRVHTLKLERGHLLVVNATDCELIFIGGGIYHMCFNLAFEHGVDESGEPTLTRVCPEWNQFVDWLSSEAVHEFETSNE